MKLREMLAPLLLKNELQSVTSSYDVVGDIAIIAISEELVPKEQLIAEAILANNNRIKVVARKMANYDGEFRTRPVKIIGGVGRKDTEVKEFGIRLRLNVEEVYFSVRSGNERKRIASLVRPGESVLVLFSGIGPYPFMISKYSLAEKIVAIEKNSIAHDFALLNVKLNKNLKNIEFIRGDVEDVLPMFTARFDRVIMVLPKSGEDFLEAALLVLKPGGHLHFYDMQNIDYFENSVAKVRAVCELHKRPLFRTEITACGHCAPRTYRICVDAQVS